MAISMPSKILEHQETIWTVIAVCRPGGTQIQHQRHSSKPCIEVIALERAIEVVLSIPCLEEVKNIADKKELMGVGLLPKETYSSPPSFWDVKKRDDWKMHFVNHYIKQYMKAITILHP